LPATANKNPRFTAGVFLFQFARPVVPGLDGDFAKAVN